VAGFEDEDENEAPHEWRPKMCANESGFNAYRSDDLHLHLPPLQGGLRRAYTQA